MSTKMIVPSALLFLLLALASRRVALADIGSRLTRQQFEGLMQSNDVNLRGVSSSRRKLKSFRFSDSPEAMNIRQELRAIEEKPLRSQTGFNADPDHVVLYENHPWNNYQRQQVQTDDQVQNADLFKPMRIRFRTKALDDTRTVDNAAQIDFIKNEILPRAAAFWSQALSVVPVSGNLKISTGELGKHTGYR